MSILAINKVQLSVSYCIHTEFDSVPTACEGGATLRNKSLSPCLMAIIFRLAMKQNRAQELDWSSKIMDNFQTPCNRYCQTSLFEYDYLDEIFKDVPSCQITDDHTEHTTPSLYDELFHPSTTKKQPATPQLDINRLDEFVVQELDFISTELSFYKNKKRGQKVKKRLFSCSGDDEPTPKKMCTVNLSNSCSEEDSEFTWSSICRS